jgi:hypothetical protein
MRYFEHLPQTIKPANTEFAGFLHHLIDEVVEVTGVEPVSKHDIQKLSTCLFFHCLSEDNRGKTNQLPS